MELEGHAVLRGGSSGWPTVQRELRREVSDSFDGSASTATGAPDWWEANRRQ
jgi:hypothetical protein